MQSLSCGNLAAVVALGCLLPGCSSSSSGPDTKLAPPDITEPSEPTESAAPSSSQEQVEAPPLKSAPELSIVRPWDRAVFQRGSDGWGSIPVHVELSQAAESATLIAHLTPLNGEEDLGWRKLGVGSGSELTGSIETAGGWYALDIAVVEGDVTLAAGRLEKVGLGEVLYIAGQSNAQGWGGAAATDDRVNVAAYEERSWVGPDTGDEVVEPSVSSVESPRFLPLKDTIGPRANGGPYYWGLFGDRLAERLGVPVLLFNAAWSGSAIQQWSDSAQGIPVYNQIEDLPYGHLKNALREWTPLLGARAVLWHQGEANATWASTDLDYARDLQLVIDRSRQDAGVAGLPWMVARVSLDQSPSALANDPNWNSDAKRQTVREAQNQVITQDPGVFAGPDTDLIGAEVRPDGVHFSSEASHDLVSQAWVDAFTKDFLEASTPILPGSSDSN